MISLEASSLFLKSALTCEVFYKSNSDILLWIEALRQKTIVIIQPIALKEMTHWHFEAGTGNIVHDSGRFFSIIGVDVRTNWGNVNCWQQPIIDQPEIGILGFISKKINGVLHFLMQAKIEPGNINFIQLSPTLQATKSNYSRVHQGNSPLYLEYFTETEKFKTTTLLDQLQSEQGARFLKKRNRNIIIEVDEEIEVYENFCWMTLYQIKTLLKYDNLINMDTRTVISGISYGEFSSYSLNLLETITRTSPNGMALLISALDISKQLYSMESLISWITRLKCKYELDVQRIALNSVRNWLINETEMKHTDNKYFSVIGVNVSISNREVKHWQQPLIKSAQEGIIGFLIKRINGIYHFLVQAKLEAGNFDIVELAPTVQCLTGNYRRGFNEYEVPFLEYFLEDGRANIISKTYQSEEGGRFYNEQNLNVIAEVGSDFPTEVPDNYCWMTLNQMYTFIQFNNYLNIQARSLLSGITFE